MIVMLVTLTGLWFAGCQKDGSGLTPVGETTALETLAGSAARYSVLTDSLTIGKCKGKLTEIAAADLSSAITAYITSNYAAATVRFAAKDADGRVIVAIVLSDGTVKGLFFKADGTFGGDLMQHPRKAKLNKVDISALPASITSYINTTYAGAVIKLVGTNVAGEYFVGILVNSKIKVVLFNADGTFSKELEKPEFAPGKPGKFGKH